jgi:PAS domain S-box-containing protein
LDRYRASNTGTAGSVLRPDAEAFRLLVESTRDYAIFLLDPKGNVASWNAGAARLKGYDADEIIGRHFSTFYTPDAIASEWPQHELREAERTGRFEDEGWRIRKDGTRFWANVIITALRDPQGNLVAFGKVTRDMTERRAHEQRVEMLTVELENRVDELARTNRELEQKSAENESFVYSVSHDLRTPLVNLQGFSQELTLTSNDLEKLLSDPAVPPAIQARALSLLRQDLTESTGFIRNAVRHLGNIIDGLLRLSRIGRIEYDAVPVDVNVVVSDILGAMHSSIVQSGATIDVRALPTVIGDKNAVGQIFANVIGNALKSFDERRPGVIQVSASTDDPPVFAIRDNGVGISPESQPKIFHVFQHVHTTTTRGEGMGLAIVRRIVERHGGRIWFESQPNVGTTFYFTLGGAREADSAPGESGTL